MIEFRPIATPDDEAEILHLDALCFPVDAPPVIAGAHWLIGRDGAAPAAYCAWKPVDHDGVTVGFHYRAGVLTEYRGHGLQREMIRLREGLMRKSGIARA